MNEREKELREQIREILKELKHVMPELKKVIELWLEHLRLRNPRNPDIQWMWNTLNRSMWIGNEIALVKGGYAMHGNAYKTAIKSISAKIEKLAEYSSPGPKPPKSFYEGKTDQKGVSWDKSDTVKAQRIRRRLREEKKQQEERKKKRELKPNPQYTEDARKKRKKRADKKKKERKTEPWP